MEASISNLYEFEEVSLGHYNQIALDVLKGKIAIDKYFKFMMFKEIDNGNNSVVYGIKQSKAANSISYVLFIDCFQIAISPSGHFFSHYQNAMQELPSIAKGLKIYEMPENAAGKLNELSKTKTK